MVAFDWAFSPPAGAGLYQRGAGLRNRKPRRDSHRSEPGQAQLEMRWAQTASSSGCRETCEQSVTHLVHGACMRHGFVAAIRRVAPHGPKAYQKRGPSERRSVMIKPHDSSSTAYARVWRMSA